MADACLHVVSQNTWRKKILSSARDCITASAEYRINENDIFDGETLGLFYAYEMYTRRLVLCK